MSNLALTRPRWRFGPWIAAIATIATAALALAQFNSRGSAAGTESDPISSSALAVGPIGITVADLDRSLAFFTTVLDFTHVRTTHHQGEEFERITGVFGAHAQVALLQLGQEQIELIDFLAPEGREVPADSRSNDLWFQHIAIVVSDMDKAYAHLRSHNVEHVSSSPQKLPDWNPNAGGIEAFYFKDPDDHVLEIIWFPPDKGDARWQRPTDELFLGIDHTAIAVRNTDASLAFYRDVLGFRVAGASENYGDAQEHLNAVFGAHLRITSVRAPDGPGIEFLEYLSPSGGRPYPSDSRANDQLHWQTTIPCQSASASADAAASAGASFISLPHVEQRSGEFKSRQTILIRDPDGHALCLTMPQSR